MMAKPEALPLLAEPAVKGVKPKKVDYNRLLNGYGEMTKQAVDRHNRVIALQEHIRDVAALKKRCGGKSSAA
jgi:hypothetical protein